MPQPQKALPQLDGQTVITDGGLETWLIFHKQVELPEFASYTAMYHDAGRAALAGYWGVYLDLARRHNAPLLLESNTWRANPEWVGKVGLPREDTASINRLAIDQLRTVREDNPDVHTVISGCVGPRGDGYVPGDAMPPDGAAEYHAEQIRVLADAGVDLVTAYTLNYADEAIGVARASADAGVACAISFTVETDGRVPDGQPLGEAIQQVDEATGASPAYFMINCAHPSHFSGIFQAGGAWIDRLRGLRSNASKRSHAELEEMEDLDDGDPVDLGRRTRTIRDALPQLSLIGGCCGTDHRHIAAMCQSCFSG